MFAQTYQSTLIFFYLTLVLVYKSSHNWTNIIHVRGVNSIPTKPVGNHSSMGVMYGSEEVGAYWSGKTLKLLGQNCSQGRRGRSRRACGRVGV
jgi:hypothetical protein